jgi:hypothetical protein
MPATSNQKLPIRAGSSFGYQVPAGAHVYAGQLLMMTAATLVQPLGVAGGVAFAGIASSELNNVGVTTASSSYVEVKRDIVIQAVVPGAIAANLGAPVYATDDITYTLSSNSGANVQVGTLAGFEGGNTWVRISR